MAEYFVLVKRKTAKKWQGAIPTKNGVSLAKIRSTFRKQLKPGFTYKVVTKTALRKMLSNLALKKR